jgi:hypothetical protein
MRTQGDRSAVVFVTARLKEVFCVCVCVVWQHLSLLAPQHVEAKFVKINAEKAPFFVEKLQVGLGAAGQLSPEETSVGLG